MKLQALIGNIIRDLPDTFNTDEAIYIYGRQIVPEALAQIADADNHDLYAQNWHRLEYLETIQTRADDHPNWTVDQHIQKCAERGLAEDFEANQTLSWVITSGEAADLFGVKEDTVRHACAGNLLPARKSGKTWLLLRYHAQLRWGK